ncbi:MAG: isoleucine--tRNA ligase [Bdellovibrionota bacterium]
MKFQKPEPQISFPQWEQDILSQWKTQKIFEKSVEEKDPDRPWAFYDGPPFATGLPHHGHLLAGTIKDVVPRYWTMRGHRIERRFGWDCHGLPIEFETEKNLGLKGRKDILEFGVDRFNEECRKIVLRYTSEWQNTVERMGRWIDFENDYKTMDLNFMESVWSVFKKLWDKGLIYEDKKVLPYSTRVTTPLSNFEANLNYQEVQDPAITVKLPLKNKEHTSLLIWTTTPWTLPANLGAAVHPDFDYMQVQCEGETETYVVGKSLLSSVFGKKKFTILAQWKGKEMEGWTYHAIIPCFEGKIPEQAHQVLLAQYITDDSGTAIVHQAPAFGEDDFEVCKRYGIPALDHVDEEGVFNSECPLFEGQYFKDADKNIIAYLKEKNLLFKHETIQHSYPFCYRSDTPLMYRAISTWFVNVTKIKEKLLENNEQTHWVPGHLKHGRFGKWLENARDWAISRNRFWGNPIPLWTDESMEEILCIGSREELEKLSGRKIDDLHKHFIDDIEITSPTTGKTLKRVPQILDCWFESGSMPYAQQHYPFSITEEEFEKKFPAEFIAEGLDQTRGWFYTLSVLSAALDKGPAFKNVIVNGIVLAEDGRKMSKRLKNYPDPVDVLKQYGADTLRIYLLQSGAVYGEDLRFSEEGLKEMTRKVLLPFYNAYSFLATYAAVDGWDPQIDFTQARDHEMDRWLSIKTTQLKQDIHREMEQYQLSKAIPPLLAFLDDLTNWYIRRSRRRFWKSENNTDKFQAYSTLYQALVEFCKISAPFIPFLSDALYKKLSLGHPMCAHASVHLETYASESALSAQDQDIETAMDLSRQAVGLGRELREKLKIKTRQPLSTLYVGVIGEKQKQQLDKHQDLIRDELNVKQVVLLPAQEMANWNIKPNFKQVGKSLGPKMKEFQNLCSQLSTQEIQDLLSGKSLQLMDQSFGPDSFLTHLEANENFKHSVHSSSTLVVAFDEVLTQELVFEGWTRELINRIQRFRKDSGLEVEDRIDLSVEASEELQRAFEPHKTLIEKETLSTIQWGKASKVRFSKDENIEEHPISLGIS